MGGAIAETFGSLLSRIWSSAAGPSSYAPREFKQQLQKFAPQFSGYQQHDSQEFIAFLLDGLHEDLNRVLKKPYVENPDWEGGGDWELVQLARKSWEGYISRNDSAIVDLFQGQYKSTLVCPECQKVCIASAFVEFILNTINRFRLRSTLSCISPCHFPSKRSGARMFILFLGIPRNLTLRSVTVLRILRFITHVLSTDTRRNR